MKRFHTDHLVKLHLQLTVTKLQIAAYTAAGSSVKSLSRPVSVSSLRQPL